MSDKTDAERQDQSDLIDSCNRALFQSRFLGQSDAYFFQVAAALSALLDNLYGKWQADFPLAASDHPTRMAAVAHNNGKRIIGITASDVTLDMNRKGKILNVDVDRKPD